ncbi:MAG: tetrahydromethanopterin S-methyltransferase subunit A [Candidatus Thorarchaeota archaeon]|nr:tetrahydromethanopterin S-methyltransferase subunit A [Candidatus Thorarchaeota archaeon]
MTERAWPPIPGDFHVKNPTSPVAICTLGKKLDIPGEYGIAGTCKTENIGIERVIVNVISNSSIRFLILAGPEVPGHLTGRSLRALHTWGIDSETRKIKDAPGAIPYIENIPLEAVERFRRQVELIDMINVSNTEEIMAAVKELVARTPGEYQEDAMWVEFGAAPRVTSYRGQSGPISLLPEFRISLNPFSSLVGVQENHALISLHPSLIGVEVRTTDTGTLLFGKEL